MRDALFIASYFLMLAGGFCDMKRKVKTASAFVAAGLLSFLFSFALAATGGPHGL